MIMVLVVFFYSRETALLTQSSSRVGIDDYGCGGFQAVTTLFCKIFAELFLTDITQVSLVSEGNPGCTVLLGMMLVGGGGDGR